MIKKELADGFLDKDLIFEVDKIRNDNKKLYDIIKKINITFYSLEMHFEKSNPSNVDLYVFTTFSQIHISFQSCVLLLERGLYEDFQIILRSIYDKIFKCLYVLEDKNNLEVLYQDNVGNQISLNKYISECELYSYIPKDKLMKVTAELEKEVKLNKNGKKIKMPDNRMICNQLGIKEAYIHYKLLSNYTHCSISVIDSKLIEDEYGLLINQGINHGDFYDEISKLILCLNYIVKPICNYLKLDDINNSFEKLLEELIKMK